MLRCPPTGALERLATRPLIRHTHCTSRCEIIVTNPKHVSGNHTTWQREGHDGCWTDCWGPTWLAVWCFVAPVPIWKPESSFALPAEAPVPRRIQSGAFEAVTRFESSRPPHDRVPRDRRKMGLSDTWSGTSLNPELGACQGFLQHRLLKLLCIRLFQSMPLCPPPPGRSLT